MLREEGYRLESVAIIDAMDAETQTIRFREQNIERDNITNSYNYDY